MITFCIFKKPKFASSQKLGARWLQPHAVFIKGAPAVEETHAVEGVAALEVVLVEVAFAVVK